MNSLSRLVAGTLGAGVLAVTSAGLASAAPTDTGTGSPSWTGSPTTDAGPTEVGQPTPEPGGTQTYLLDGLGVPLPDPTLGVPKVLEAGVIPLAALSDASGESGTAPGAGAPSAGSY